ncbi:GLPGLI family protein [Flavobacterium channae]|uniref:GLPGLI family protein n=1 Tax=Flavobacterium channae TaxID=2897181 RepID=UPI001E3DDA4B|nr:GLPGLI family protein [Flavobacterium channae]UGS23701.1 GLPGLI family protein [Flavobacterium channae]
MIHKKVVVILLFSLNILFSQSGQVVYEAMSKKYPETKENKGDVQIKNLENARISFELKFNNQNSFFYKLSLNKEDGYNLAEETLLIMLGFKEVYFELKEKLLHEDYGEFLIKTPSNHNWNISSESKKINNYLCYKATCTESYTARDGKNKERVITAWFCPELPYSYGPLEYNGLPGLILELEKNGNKVVAKSIVLSDKKISLELPNKKRISKEEYNQKIKENSEF